VTEALMRVHIWSSATIFIHHVSLSLCVGV
jgi:hypothetical protein